MTNNQDLSLLTEFERGLWRSLRDSDQDIPAYSTHHMRVVLSHLIAARAENKRLRHEAKIALDFLHDWEASDFQAADEGVQSSFYMTVGGLRHALLQSEKGGE